MRRLLSRGKTSPFTTLCGFLWRIDTVFRAGVVPTRTRPCFRWSWCRPRSGSAPVTPQDQGRGRGPGPDAVLPAPGHDVAPEHYRCRAASTKGAHRSVGSHMGPTPGWLTAWAFPSAQRLMQGHWRAGTVAHQVWWL
jgi:hypothetical protein